MTTIPKTIRWIAMALGLVIPNYTVLQVATQLEINTTLFVWPLFAILLDHFKNGGYISKFFFFE